MLPEQGFDGFEGFEARRGVSAGRVIHQVQTESETVHFGKGEDTVCMMSARR